MKKPGGFSENQIHTFISNGENFPHHQQPNQTSLSNPAPIVHKVTESQEEFIQINLVAN